MPTILAVPLLLWCTVWSFLINILIWIRKANFLFVHVVKEGNTCYDFWVLGTLDIVLALCFHHWYVAVCRKHNTLLISLVWLKILSPVFHFNLRSSFLCWYYPSRETGDGIKQTSPLTLTSFLMKLNKTFTKHSISSGFFIRGVQYLIAVSSEALVLTEVLCVCLNLLLFHCQGQM